MNIRPIAISLIINSKNGKLLVFSGYHPKNDLTYYRPLGGGIDFGERATDTIVREMKEEISAEITNVEYIMTIENIFEHNDAQGHEIVFLMRADLVDKNLYQQEKIVGDENGNRFYAYWIPIAECVNGERTLFPPQLVDYLAENRELWA